jgi:hypothetical protein
MLHQFEPCVGQYEPLGAGALEVDLYPGVLAVALATHDHAFPELAVSDPLSQPNAAGRRLTNSG